jgi:hypothetical protein
MAARERPRGGRVDTVHWARTEIRQLLALCERAVSDRDFAAAYLRLLEADERLRRAMPPPVNPTATVHDPRRDRLHVRFKHIANEAEAARHEELVDADA